MRVPRYKSLYSYDKTPLHAIVSLRRPTKEDARASVDPNLSTILHRRCGVLRLQPDTTRLACSQVDIPRICPRSWTPTWKNFRPDDADICSRTGDLVRS